MEKLGRAVEKEGRCCCRWLLIDGGEVKLSSFSSAPRRSTWGREMRCSMQIC